MTIPVSQVDAVKDYLFTQISALTILTQQASGIQPTRVFYDVVGENEPEEMIEVGFKVDQAAKIHNLVGSGGAGFLYEAFDIVSAIRVWRNGDDAPGTWKRAKALSDAIDNMLRTDPSCGGLVIVAYPSKHVYDSGWDKGGKGRITTVEYEAHFEVEI